VGAPNWAEGRTRLAHLMRSAPAPATCKSCRDRMLAWRPCSLHAVVCVHAGVHMCVRVRARVCMLVCMHAGACVHAHIASMHVRSACTRGVCASSRNSRSALDSPALLHVPQVHHALRVTASDRIRQREGLQHPRAHARTHAVRRAGTNVCRHTGKADVWPRTP